MDTIVACLTSIVRFAPFVNIIYLVVASDAQVEHNIELRKLVETVGNKIVVVRHQQLIPAAYLPTFNSTTIERFLHNIAGLSDNFIYLNDDVLFGAPTDIGDFFALVDNNLVHKIRIQEKHVNATDKHPWVQALLQNQQRLQKFTNKPKEIYRPLIHGVQVVSKAILKEVDSRFPMNEDSAHFDRTATCFQHLTSHHTWRCIGMLG